MCGITGLRYEDHAKRVDEAMLVGMRDKMIHRGPDDKGLYIDGPVGLAHRRLSIIDLSKGCQPMSTPDGRFTIVFNGEIYNYRNLRTELEKDGVGFTTYSDTEVLLQWFVARGRNGLHDLNGIFAFGIWDREEKCLFLVRDRMGIKPLYYAHSPQGLVFASEIKALFESDLVTPTLNPATVPEYFIWRHVAGDQNLFEGVKNLLPGHILTLNANGLKLEPYWTPELSVQTSKLGFVDAANEFRNILRSAIESQLMSDVPLGTFCSGGIDSSLVTAIAAEATGQPINTYSVGFHERSFDETAYARMVANQYRTNHHELRLDASEYSALLPDLIWRNDLPLNFANSVQIFAISKLAKQQVTVVLTGEGADELFGGYPRYYIPRLLSLFQKLPRTLRNTLIALLKAVNDHRVEKLRDYANQSINDVILYNSVSFDHRRIPPCFTTDWPIHFDYRENIIARGNNAGLDSVSILALLDQQTYLVSILNRQDKMSMAASVEARVPFLDNSVVTFANSLPIKAKQTTRHRKRILKAVANHYLPIEVTHRRKSGFGVPLGEWMRGQGPLADWISSLPQNANLTEFFSANAIQEIVDSHQKGSDHGDFLWSCLNFVIWRERFGV